jgi:Sulfotransferase family
MRLEHRQGSAVDLKLLGDQVLPTEFSARALQPVRRKQGKFMQYARGNRDANAAAVGDALGRRLWRFDVEALCARARRTTGLEDFGAPPLEPALSLLADSLEREANLHPLGRFLMRMHLLDLLKTRLRLVAAWKRQPEDVESSPIARPIFITGMPRSGSTFLHELLAADPALRAPRIWEVMSPVAANEPDAGWRDRRVWNAATRLWWFRRLSPEADAVFPMRARMPHECVAIHSYTLMSEEFVSSCRVPAYEAFLRSADLVPVYQWERRFLQHLQQRQGVRRWVLKAPDHAHALEALFSVFPDATVIQTHREPLEVLKSSIHLTRVLRGLYGRPDDPIQIAEREARVLAATTDRLARFRNTHPDLGERFVDVRYGELTADPLAVINRLYRRFDLTMTPEAAGRIGRLALRRSRYRGRRAIPNLADLGLDELTLAGLIGGRPVSRTA